MGRNNDRDRPERATRLRWSVPRSLLVAPGRSAFASTRYRSRGSTQARCQDDERQQSTVLAGLRQRAFVGDRCVSRARRRFLTAVNLAVRRRSSRMILGVNVCFTYDNTPGDDRDWQARAYLAGTVQRVYDRKRCP